METLMLVLLIVAAVLFLLAAVGVAASRLNLVALGLFCWVCVEVLHHTG